MTARNTFTGALDAAIKAAGGYKAVAFMLWPRLKPGTAYARVKACLSDNKAEKLSLDEILEIAHAARAAGDHSVMRFLAHELGYTEPTPIEPADQRAQLQSQFVAAVQQLEQIQRAMGRVGGRK